MRASEQRLICGDCLTILPTLEERSAHCVVTSPPYFALRSYLPKDHPDKGKEIGSEPTPEAFIETMVRVFREVRRVLRDDGVCFVNLGDSYNAGTRVDRKFKREAATKNHGYWSNDQIMQRVNVEDMATGQLLNIPHRVAEALRADGWIWRQTIVWAKRSPMPESVQGWRWTRCRVKVRGHQRDVGYSNSTDGRPQSDSRHTGPYENGKWSDCPGCPKCTPNGGYVLRRGSGRCTTAHEYIFILTRTSRYFWDSEQSKEPQEQSGIVRQKYGYKHFWGNIIDHNQHIEKRQHDDAKSYGPEDHPGTGRNPRSVWTLSSEPTSEHHFATFPSELVRRCLSAGVSGGGCCPECGAAWAPVVDVFGGLIGQGWTDHGADIEMGSRQCLRADGGDTPYTRNHLGYRPTCTCGKTESSPCTVLDPFAGIGTVAQVARHMGHNSISVELNPKYVEIARERVLETPRCFLRMGAMPAMRLDQAGLFDDLAEQSAIRNLQSKI